MPYVASVQDTASNPKLLYSINQKVSKIVQFP